MSESIEKVLTQDERLECLQTEPCILEPTQGRCVIVRDGFKYSGKIAIPEKYKRLPTTGKVVAVGDEDHRYLLGRRVAWGRYSGIPFQFGESHVYDVMTYDEIMAFVNDKEAQLSMDDLSSLTREE